MRILIVDDNQDGADMLGAIYRNYGAEVCVRYNGNDAINAAHEFKPQLVILDLSMPGINGFDTALELKKQPWSKDAFYVAHTGSTKALLTESAKTVGFDHILIKPAEIAQYEAILVKLRARFSQSL